jgi:RecA-family ATPase
MSETTVDHLIEEYERQSSNWMEGTKGVLTGRGLTDAIEKGASDPIALIEGFLYKDSVLMVYADSGVGKSTVVLNAMVQACSGNPVFGGLHVDKPITVYWILGERTPSEPLSRMKRMLLGIDGFLPYRFLLDYEMQGIDILDPVGQEKAINILKLANQVNPIDVVVFDPIYAMVSGGLSEDKSATAFTRFSSRVQKEIGCSNILIHHSNRGGRDKNGKRQQGDMYGSRWLDAHCSAIYHLDNNGNDAWLKKKKDNHSVLLDKINLFYDAETDLSYMSQDGKHISKIDHLKLWLKEQKRLDSTFSFNDMKEAIQVSTSNLRRLMMRQLELGITEVSKSAHGKKLYKCG